MASIIENVRGADWHHLLPHRSGDERVNVGTAERVLSAAAGAALVTFGLRRRRLRGLLLPLGGGLIMRGLTGRCPVGRALGRNSARRQMVASPVASVAGGDGIKVERTVLISRAPEEIWSFWRDFENLPRFMEHLESVRVLDQLHSRWVARAPAGTRVEWDAEIHNEIPGELIAWRSLPGADVNNAGSVHFEPAARGNATRVRVVLSYEPPAGRLGAAVATLFGEEPAQQVEEDLRRLKQVLESGEVAAR
ncbi:MAG TPA: SRPBCC family protein [Gemmatimonadales bacterium]|nr:SRPBCC family protein [Gemmatimonadales bacterium]